MSNEIVKASVPAHLQKYVHDKPNVKQMGHIDSSDIGINMIKLGHAQNKECKRAGWGVTGQEPQVPVGSMFLSRDGKIIPPGTNFIPLLRTVKYIKWTGKPGQDGRIDFSTDDENDARIKAIKGLEFRKDSNSGENLPPLVTKYINFYIMIQGVELPILLSFKRTAIPDGKALTSSLIMATQGNLLDYFCLVFTFNQPKIVRDGDQDWFGFSITPAGFTPPQAIEKAEKMCRLAESLSEITSPAEFEGEEPVKHTQAANEPTQATQQILQGAAVVIPQQQQQQAAPPAPPALLPPAMTNATPPPPLQTAPNAAPAAMPAVAGGVEKMW
jgi:hypothetical protein